MQGLAPISKKFGDFGEKGWFEKLAREEPALYGEAAPGVRIQMLTDHHNSWHLLHMFPGTYVVSIKIRSVTADIILIWTNVNLTV